MTPLKQPRIRESLLGAVIAGAVNGIIAWIALKGEVRVPLSMDSIGSPGITALGNAATVVFSLTFINTCISFLIYRRIARKAVEAPPELRSMPFLSVGLGLAASNTILQFGGFVAAAVLWQRLMGTIMVSPFIAAIILGMIAMVAAALADLRTKREMMDKVLRSRAFAA